MIGLDTSVLCRYLLADDPQQTKVAARVIEGAADREEPCFISKIVLCELVWVLESCTSMKRAGIAEVVGRILHASNLEVEQPEMAHRSLALFKKHGGDFADYLIHESNLFGGSQKTLTFDEELRGIPGVEVL